MKTTTRVRIADLLDRWGMPNFAISVRYSPDDVAFWPDDPQPWADNDLSWWHAEHRTPGSGVWAVHPPCGYGSWRLHPPGTQLAEHGYVQRADVADYHPATAEFGGDSDRTVLADVRRWMWPWVEDVAGARVVEMVEGWSDGYGPDRDQHEYVIYARVERGRS